MRYEVTVAGRRLAIDAVRERFLVDGEVIAADVRELVRGRQWSVTLDGLTHEITALGGAPPRFLIDGREVAVAVADERTLAAGGGRAGAAGGRHEIRAPMPGLLKAVHVREGDRVEHNDAVATLEAMKMENELRAPARARVLKIAVAPGTKVEGGALLAVLADEP